MTQKEIRERLSAEDNFRTAVYVQNVLGALQELLLFCITLNRDDFSVFFSYSGHVDMISVYYYLEGWDATDAEDNLEDGAVWLMHLEKIDPVDGDVRLKEVQQQLLDAFNERRAV